MLQTSSSNTIKYREVFEEGMQPMTVISGK